MRPFRSNPSYTRIEDNATQTRSGVLRYAAPGAAKPPRLVRAAAKRHLPELGALGWALGAAIVLHYGAAWLGYDTVKLEVAGTGTVLGSALAATPPSGGQIQVILGQRTSLLIYPDSSLPRHSASTARSRATGARGGVRRGERGAPLPLRKLTPCPQVSPIKREANLDPAALSRELAPCLARALRQ
jgi:hypothetical protein